MYRFAASFFVQVIHIQVRTHTLGVLGSRTYTLTFLVCAYDLNDKAKMRFGPKMSTKTAITRVLMKLQKSFLVKIKIELRYIHRRKLDISGLLGSRVIDTYFAF